MKIDNFALTNHQTCPAQYDLRIRQGWTVRRKSAALGFGASLHSGLAAWHMGQGIDAAIDAIESGWQPSGNFDDFRTLDKCVTVMKDYAKRYPSESFKVVGINTDRPMIEIAFTLPMGIWLPCEHCEPGANDHDNRDKPTCVHCGKEKEDLEYGGIFDGCVEFGGPLYILEHKTTTQLGSMYFEQFKPNNQVSGYIWAAGQLSGAKVTGAIINAIGLYKSSPTKFDRKITSRSDQGIAQWKDNVYYTAIEIKHHERTGFWPKRTNACTLYGLCAYHSVHVLDNPVEQQKRLETDYIREPWDYERRDP